MIQKSIPSDIAPPSSLLLRCLDQPVFSVMSITYADILKKQFSLSLTTTTNNTANNQPPRKRQATILDYDSDQLQASPPSTVNTSTTHGIVPQPLATTIRVNYEMELLSLKTEINSLRTIITNAVEQFKTAIAEIEQHKQEIVSLHAPVSNAMETDLDHSAETTTDLSDLIAELKHDIATLAREMRATSLLKKTYYSQPTNQNALP